MRKRSSSSVDAMARLPASALQTATAAPRDVAAWAATMRIEPAWAGPISVMVQPLPRSVPTLSGVLIAVASAWGAAAATTAPAAEAARNDRRSTEPLCGVSDAIEYSYGCLSSMQVSRAVLALSTNAPRDA